MAHWMGIDGGGTKTVCAVGDGVRLLAQARGGSCKATTVGAEAAAANLRRVIQEALDKASLAPGDISGCCAGIAGVSLPEVRTVVEEVLRERFGNRILIVGDDRIALEAAFPGGSGILLISGTGSICIGRGKRKGMLARSGGYGPVVSDEGSGGWIGRRAVSAALLALDAGATGHLTRRILAAWECKTQEDLLRVANSAPQRAFASLFPHVLEAEKDGDTLARHLLSEAGRELGHLVSAVAARLGEDGNGIVVRGVGGVLEHSLTVRTALTDELRSTVPKARYDDTLVEPVMGALYLAARQNSEQE